MRSEKFVPLLAGAILASSGCASGAGEQMGAPAPDAPGEAVDPEPPELSIEERWAAPFAVVSSGKPEPGRRRTVAARAQEPTTRSNREPTPSPPAVPENGERPSGQETGDGYIEHRVQQGETWFGIARRYEISRSALAAANPDVEPERLRAGEVLLIPSSTAASPGGVRHRVVEGDSLWGIARRYGVEMERIRAANNLSSDRVRIGQVLVIPVR
jgi:LysM repeat protein